MVVFFHESSCRAKSLQTKLPHNKRTLDRWRMENGPRKNHNVRPLQNTPGLHQGEELNLPHIVTRNAGVGYVFKNLNQTSFLPIYLIYRPPPQHLTSPLISKCPFGAIPRAVPCRIVSCRIPPKPILTFCWTSDTQ